MGAGSNKMDAALHVRFYSAAHLNKEMTRAGYHWVDEDNQPVKWTKDLDTTHLKRVLCTCIHEETGAYSELVKRANIRDGYHVVPKAPVFEDVTMITIRKAGEMDYIDTFAWLDFGPNPNPGAHNIRFRRQYEHFLAKSAGDLLIGEPIENLAKTNPPILKLSQVEDLKHKNIRTIQALVNMAAPEGIGIMGINNIIARAKEHLAEVERTFPAQQFEMELKKRDELLQGQAAQIAELTKQLNAMGGSAIAPKRRGRPKKTAEADATTGAA